MKHEAKVPKETRAARAIHPGGDGPASGEESEPTATFRQLYKKLTKPQREAVDQIALASRGEGYGRKLLERIEKTGLIVGADAVLGGRFPVRIRVYSMPLHHHIEWCKLMSELEGYAII